jgi:Arc/MetJ-type ribon-helix-helix transcriptional regulator
MHKLSLSLEDRHVEEIEERVEEGDAESKSAAVRAILDEYEDLTTECEDLRGECSDLRTRVESREERIEELEEQLARRSQIEDRVEDVELELAETREDLTAPAPVRWWRWIRQYRE